MHFASGARFSGNTYYIYLLLPAAVEIKESLHFTVASSPSLLSPNVVGFLPHREPGKCTEKAFQWSYENLVGCFEFVYVSDMHVYF